MDTCLKQDAIYKSMYRHIDSDRFSSCIRRFNGTHQVGCSTKFEGNIGILWGIKNDGDLEVLLHQATQKEDIMILFYNAEFYNISALDAITDNNLSVTGMFVFDNYDRDRFTHSSTDDTCPLSSSGMYAGDETYANCKKGVWNPKGNDLFYQDLNIPVTLLFNKTDADFMYDHCFKAINMAGGGEDKKCKVQVKALMFGALSTPICMRRSNSFIDDNTDFCIPLGGVNVFSFLDPIVNVTKPEVSDDQILLLLAHMDSHSMFSLLSPGGHSALTSVIPMILVARAMASTKPQRGGGLKSVMYAFMNGESFDYIGSSRMVYDINNHQLPGYPALQMSHFHEIIELNQLSGNDIYIHSDARSIKKNPELRKKMTSLYDGFSAKTENNITWHKHIEDMPLPPSSVQAFLKHDSLIPAIVITDHKVKYSNRFYNSQYDGLDLLDELDDLTSTLTAVANRVFQYTHEKVYEVNATHVIDPRMTRELIDCFLLNYKCKLFNDTLDGTLDIKDTMDSSHRAVLDTFIGTATVDGDPFQSISPLPYMISRLMGSFSGEHVPEITNRAQCLKANEGENNELYTWMWIQGPLSTNETRESVCKRTMSKYSVAMSPAFIIEDYDWRSGKYSSWSESYEGKHSIRIFVSQSEHTKMLYLLVCIPYFVTFALIVIVLYFKSDYIFDLVESETSINTVSIST